MDPDQKIGKSSEDMRKCGQCLTTNYEISTLEIFLRRLDHEDSWVTAILRNDNLNSTLHRIYGAYC